MVVNYVWEFSGSPYPLQAPGRCRGSGRVVLKAAPGIGDQRRVLLIALRKPLQAARVCGPHCRSSLSEFRNAQNGASLAMYPFGRFLMVVSRSVHEIVWALIFVSVVGLGALPGILAIAMRSVGFISKITAEAIENIDKNPVEAIRAVGGNEFQVLYYGILPQIYPVVLATVIFEWDINIRRSAVMGLVGAGGLGLLFFRQMNSFNYGGVTMVILAILMLIVIGEIISHYLRKAVI